MVYRGVVAALHLEPGSIFASDFRVLRPLSEGGMGAVYVAEQLSTRAQRALKLMHPELVRNAALRARFEQEARVASQIPSDHVVQVIAAGVDQASGTPWLAMELLDGTDLLEAAATGRAQRETLREIMEQLCHGLSAAHEAGIVHRDLKPENIFLAAPRRPGVPFTIKILDFGIAKVAEQARTHSETAALGTPLWMAPEQAGAGGSISPRTDVWPLGLIAFWLLTGRFYWKAARADGTTLQAVLKEVLFDPLVPASVRAAELGHNQKLPPGFDAWFARAVARDPAARFATARDAYAALLVALDAAPSVDPFGLTAWGGVPKTRDDIPPLRLSNPTVSEQTAAALPAGNLWTAPSQGPASAPPQHPQWTPQLEGVSVGQTSPDPPRRVQSSRVGWWLAAGVGLAGIVTVGTLATLQALGRRHPAPSPTPNVVCPKGTERRGNDCVKEVDRTCPSGFRFKENVGCVALVKQPVVSPQNPYDSAPSSGTSYGRATIDCSPACDQVSIDGKKMGPSPVKQVPLKAGSHELLLQKVGYQRRSTTLTITGDRSTSIRYKMLPAEDCDPPYKKDSKGAKRLKPECF